MKKLSAYLLIPMFIIGLTPIHYSSAITQNQISAEVQIVCTDGNDNWFSGSGTIIDPKGIILTNRHVVEGAYQNTCIVGFVRSINEDPDFGSEGKYNLAEVKYLTTTNEMDAAILYLENPSNIDYPYVNIWDSNSSSLQFGEKIEVIGFPSIGGSTITYTSGDFSGFGSAGDGTHNYIKATAALEHGNSGGAAYNSAGKFIGIPTMVVAGTLNSLSYILSIDSIKSWLSGFLGEKFKDEVIVQKPIIQNRDTNIINDVTPPNIQKTNVDFCEYRNDTCYSTNDFDWYRGSNVSNPQFTWTGVTDESGLRGYYVYFGTNIIGNPISDGIFIENNYYRPQIVNIDTYYLIIQAIDKKNNVSDKIIYKYLYNPDAIKDYGINFYIYSDAEKNDYFGNYKRNPDLRVTGTKFYIEWDDVDQAGYDIDLWVNENYEAGDKEYGKDWGHISVKRDFTKKNGYSFNINELGKEYKISVKRSGFDKWFQVCTILSYPPKMTKQIAFNEWGSKEDTNKEIVSILETELKYYIFNYSKSKYYELTSKPDSFNYYKDRYIYGGFPINDMLIGIFYDKFIFMRPGDEEFPGNWSFSTKEPYRTKYLAIKNKYKIKVPELSQSDINAIQKLIDPPLPSDPSINKHSGLIFLQVEENGEAYYIYPVDKKRYYLGRPADAYNVMRKLGLGAKHDFISSYTYFPDHVSGRILIDVEKNGEAYYIYPKNKKAYYLGRPADAFKIMRELGLGITNLDLNKIPAGNL